MIKILLDTNIILDVALKRHPHYDHSAALFVKLDEKEFGAYITATTVSDIYYIAKKAKGHQTAIHFLESLLYIVDILGIDKKIILMSLESEFPDFEDAIQSYASEINGIQRIITGNAKDFLNSAIKIQTPIQFLEEIK